MARASHHLPRDTSNRRVWVYVGVIAFVVIDILLISLALKSHATATAETVVPISTFGSSSLEPTLTSTAVATPTSTPSPTAAPAAVTILPVPATRLLSAVDATTAWRAQTGACPTATASPELTADAGVTWTKTDASGPTQVTALQNLTATSKSIVTLVGLSKVGCAPQLVETFVAGTNYSSYPNKLGSAWYVDPADRATVHSPTGAEKPPCDAVTTLAVRDGQNAAALCADGRMFSTTDAAATWSAPASLPGVVTLTDTTAGYLTAAVGRSECVGVNVLSLSPSLQSVLSGCYSTLTAAQSLSSNVALSAASGTLWIWAGDSLGRSFDGGVTWK